MNKLNWTEDQWNEYFPKGFVLPSNLFIFATMNTSEKIRYIGMHYLDEELESNDIRNVLCFYIDFNTLRKVYLKSDIKYRKEILNYIYPKSYVKAARPCAD